MVIDGVSQSTGADRQVTLELGEGGVTVAVRDRGTEVELARAVAPTDGLMDALASGPAGPRQLADGIGLEVRRNEVWLTVREADAAVGLDDLMDALADATLA